MISRMNVHRSFWARFRGLLTGVNDDDLVTVIFGGYGCGE